MLRMISVLMVCVALSACDGASGPTRVYFPTLAAPGEVGPTPTLPAWLYKPSGPGPFPGMVVLHTCGGIDNFLRLRAMRLAGLGYVSIVPDSFSPRGTGNVCTTNAVNTKQRMPDAEAAANYLRTLPEVRADRIGVIGFSHGAMTALELAQHPNPAAPFRAAVAYYPACSSEASSIGVPTLVLTGAKDDWTPSAPCAAWGARVNDVNKLNVIVYPDAYHGFDQPTSQYVQGGHGIVHRLQYDSGATTDADARTDAFLASWLKR